MQSSEMIGLMVVLLAVGTVGGVQVLLAVDFAMEKLKRRRPGKAMRLLRIPWTCLSIIGLGCVAYAHWVEPFRFETTHHTIRTDALPDGAFLRILQLTDLHLEGEGPATEYIAQTVAKEQPDVIALTGDYLNDFVDGKQAFEKLLARLKPTIEMDAVVGNYDGFDPRSVNADVITLCGFARSIDVRGGKHVNVFGIQITDAADFTKAYRSAPRGDFNVVLYHTPEMIDVAAACGADLFLCGHTHGGQVRLPLYGAVVTFSDTGKKYEAGRYKVGKMIAYVCRGIGNEGGNVPRLRFLCRPEIAVFDIVGTGD